MPERIHLVLSAAEKERYRMAAARVGQSLSEWLRLAAEEKAAAAEEAVALDSADALRVFFAACDEREEGTEPDWEVQREVIEASIRRGAGDA
jgi:hypothetical protein